MINSFINENQTYTTQKQWFSTVVVKVMLIVLTEA